MSYNTDPNIKAQVDVHLKELAAIECKMGNDSTDLERLAFKIDQLVVWWKIREIDKEYYNEVYLAG